METDKRELYFNGFALLASLFIVLSGSLFSLTAIYLLAQIFCILLIIWALLTIKVSKENQKYRLPKGYFFADKGPYEIIRHPIYTGYLLIMINFVEIDFTPLRLLAIIILGCAIFMKILREEYTIMQIVKEYKNYKAKTKALIPYLL